MILSAAPTTFQRAGQNAAPLTPKAEGLRLEQIVATRLPQALHGQWFEVKSTGANRGLNYAQPDFILLTDPAIVIECKRVVYPSVWSQLAFYRQVVEKAYGRLAAGFVVTAAKPRRGRYVFADSIEQACKFCLLFPKVVLVVPLTA